jgi:hypothetical protein
LSLQRPFQIKPAVISREHIAAFRAECSRRKGLYSGTFSALRATRGGGGGHRVRQLQDTHTSARRVRSPTRPRGGGGGGTRTAGERRCVGSCHTNFTCALPSSFTMCDCNCVTTLALPIVNNTVVSTKLKDTVHPVPGRPIKRIFQR